MKRFLILIMVTALAYLASGFYIIEGNQQGVVRRFGRVVRLPSGGAAMRGSGLHYDWPWPFAQVDRVNLNEARTLKVGSVEVIEDDEFLPAATDNDASQFLTGDKNILNLQISVQYHVSGSQAPEYLFSSVSVEDRLRQIVEAHIADLVAGSGVDFVHPLGLGELRRRMTDRTRDDARASRLGIEVDDVVIDAVSPPIQVKANFLDVSNARADKEQYIHTARAYAEQRMATAQAESRQIRDEAETDRHQQIELARGQAESFEKLVRQLRDEERAGIHSYSEARQMALRRRYIEAVSTILRRADAKILLDSERPADLTIFPETE